MHVFLYTSVYVCVYIHIHTRIYIIIYIYNAPLVKLFLNSNRISRLLSISDQQWGSEFIAARIYKPPMGFD